MDEYADRHADRRDAKRARKSRMVVSGRSTKTVLLRLVNDAQRRRKVKRNVRRR